MLLLFLSRSSSYLYLFQQIFGCVTKKSIMAHHLFYSNSFKAVIDSQFFFVFINILYNASGSHVSLLEGVVYTFQLPETYVSSCPCNMFSIKTNLICQQQFIHLMYYLFPCKLLEIYFVLKRKYIC